MVANNNTTHPPPWSSKKENTKPIWLPHAHQRLPQCSTIVPTAKNEAIDSQKQAWKGLEKEKPVQPTKNSPWPPWTILRPLFTAPISTSINPNTLSTSNDHFIDTPINQMGQRPNICSSNGSRQRNTTKGRKWTDSSDFFRRPSKASTETPLPPFPNSSNS